MYSEGCSALGRVYHEGCFKCSKCNTNLGEKFFTNGDEPCCEECFQTYHSPKCGICHLPVSSDGVELKDNNESVFHSQCLKCSKCSHPLDGKFFSMEDESICENCIAKGVNGTILIISTSDICLLRSASTGGMLQLQRNYYRRLPRVWRQVLSSGLYEGSLQMTWTCKLNNILISSATSATLS